jgi:hypothetical protein
MSVCAGYAKLLRALGKAADVDIRYVVSPQFFARGLSLVDPTRSQVTVAGAIRLQIDNPRGQHLLASFEHVDRPGQRTDCQVSGSAAIEIGCSFPGEGRYHVGLFANDARFGRYDFVGQLGVNNAP